MPGIKADWELYDLNTDCSEKHNIAAKHPACIQKMVKEYTAWAKRCMVEPYPGQDRGR